MALKLSQLDGTNGVSFDGIDAGENSGHSVAGAGDVNGDGIDDVIIGTPGAGRSNVVFGAAGGFAADFDLSTLDGANGFRVNGADGYDYAGFSVAGAGDLNGDGLDDLIIGAPGESQSYLVFGSSAGFAADLDLSSLDGTDGFRLDGIGASGSSVAGAGDVNGDGIDDVIIGAPQYGSYVDKSYVVFGSAAGFDASLDLSALDGTDGFRLDGANSYYASGSSVSAAGDVNSDGIGDLIVGDLGRSYVVFGFTAGFAASLDFGTLDGANGFRLDGTDEQFVSSVAGAGDVNGDDIDDLIVEAGGKSYVVFGSSSGFAASLDVTALDGTDGFQLNRADAYSYTGSSVAGAGDVNGDGLDDLLIGFGGYGEAYVVFGSAVGFAASIDVTALDGTDGFRLDNTNAYDQTGFSVAGAGDVNGDGIDDLIVGAPDTQGLSGGSSYVIYGSAQLGGANDAPAAANDHVRADSRDVVDLAADNGCGSDHDPDLDDLTIAAIGGVPVTAGESVTLASGLRVTFLGGSGVRFDAPGFPLGPISDGFSYEISDGRGGSDTATVSVEYLQRAIPLAELTATLDVSELDGTNGFRLRGESEGDQTGWSVDGAGDVNGDGIDDLIIGARVGKCYVVFGTAAGFAASLDLAALDGANGFRLDAIHPSPYSSYSISVAGAGDINGDGIDDLIIGSKTSDTDGELAGETYVVFGSVAGFTPTFDLAALDGTNGFRVDGLASLDYAGASVAGAGDVNGDGIDDLIIGAPGIQAERSYVVFGSASGFGPTLDLAALNGANGFRIDGAGFSVAAADDVNGDGVDDLIVGSPLASPGGRYESGETHIVFGSTAGFTPSLDLAAVDGTNGFRIEGINPWDWSGYSVAAAGDVNGDGIDDLIVRAPAVFGGPDASYVVFGSADGFATNFDLAALDGTNGFRLDGEHGSGISVAGAGDINADGIDDLIVGGDGTSWVVFGSADGFTASFDPAALSGAIGFRIDAGGPSVAGAGDVDGDGIDDLIVGVPSNGYYSTGDGYVVFGSAQLGGANDAPLARDDVLSVESFEVVDLAADHGAGRDLDPDLDDLTITAINGVPAGTGDSVTLASGLRVTVVSATEVEIDAPGVALGTVLSESFVYEISDGRGASDDGTVFFGYRKNAIDLASLNGGDGFRLDVPVFGYDSYIDVAGAGDVNGDGFDDLIIGSSGNVVHTFNGESFVVFGAADGFPGSLDISALDGNDGFRIHGLPNGSSVAGAGDINGDGIDDIIVARTWGIGGSCVVFGSNAGFEADLDLSTLDGMDGFLIEGSSVPVAGAGDVNGDGIDDLIVGGVYVLLGTNTGFAASVDVSALDGANGFRLDGSGGEVAGGGDLNADGIDDLIVGGAYVVFGRSNGFESRVDLLALDGSDGFRLDGAGGPVAGAGDVNGDGIDDLIIGDPAFEAPPYGVGPGASYLVFGSASGFGATLDLSTLDGSNGFRIDGIDAGDRSGASVAGAGDVNDDGIDDIIVGAPGRNESCVVFGSSSGFAAHLALAEVDGLNGYRLVGGSRVSGAGDVNGDGIDDLMVADTTQAADSAYVVFGSRTERTGMTIFSVTASSDDAEQRTPCAQTDLGSHELEIGETAKKLVGLRFTGLDVPEGATITEAYVEFQAAESDACPSHITIALEDSTDAATYGRCAGRISARSYLDDSTCWSPEAWVKGGTYRTADLTATIAALIGTDGLDADEALAFRFTGKGERAAAAFESSSAAPKLVIAFETGAPGTSPVPLDDFSSPRFNDASADPSGDDLYFLNATGDGSSTMSLNDYWLT